MTSTPHTDVLVIGAARLLGRAFDLLFINAGTTNTRDETRVDVATEEFSRIMITNALSPIRVLEILRSLVQYDGPIAVMSSGQGASPKTTAAASKSIEPRSRR